MDGRRFDELARVVAAGGTRRRVLGALLGGVLTATGMGGRRMAVAQACVNPVACVTTEDCCPGAVCEGSYCQDDGPPCLFPGEPCGEDAECCTLVCTEGVCAEDDLPPPCLPGGAPCTEPFDCCFGDCLDGVCVGDEPPPIPTPDIDCLDDGDPCADSFDCCDGACRGGVCGSCPDEGTPCADSDACCPDSGLFCVDGACAFTDLCFDAPCATTADCCSIPDLPLVCEEGVCVFESTLCLPDGAPCGGVFECCPGSACVDGTCQVLDDGTVGPGPDGDGGDGTGGETPPVAPSGEVVTALPSTGGPRRGEGTASLGGLTIAAGAAALLGARALRRREGADG